MQRVIALWLAMLLAACRTTPTRSVRPTDFPFAVDSFRTQTVRPGVTHAFVYTARGPWAIHLLDVDRTRCWTVRAAKSEDRAAGRERTSASLRQLAEAHEVAGGVNADFFVTTGALAGLPLGAFIIDSRVIAGPGPQPVFGIDARGTAFIGALTVRGRATVGGASHELVGWNREVAGGLSLFDSAWGAATDTASGVIEVVLDGSTPTRVATVDTLPTAVAIPRGGAVLRAGRTAPEELRRALVGLRAGDSVVVEIAIAPRHPRTAVGGRPALVRDSAVIAGIDTVGQAGFATSRHPRTAVGIADRGRRLLLVVVDGRQAPYSDGMTLREMADLMRSLGVHDAVNLDGGGSTALVYADPDSTGAFRLANRPSDPGGERAVGNALAIVRECAG